MLYISHYFLWGKKQTWMLSMVFLDAYRFGEEMQNTLSIAFLGNSACLFKGWL